MGRLYIGVGLLAAMLAAGIFLGAAFADIHGPLIRQAEQARAAAAAGDWETARQALKNARAHWAGHRDLVAAVADHEPLEQMDALFARLEALGKLEKADEFCADCAELASVATAMAQSQQTSWWNLL